MGYEVESRVTEMRLDNRDFERNARVSLSTLQRLRDSLNLPGSAKALSEVREESEKMNFSTMNNALSTIHQRFTALEVVGVTALVNIANTAVNAGKRMVKALTIEPISDGFKEYELKMGSVQTIMASTGASLQEVNAYLAELNTYSDRTIYSFADMTQNIGKFTNNGVKLKDAVKAIQGISNEAALSGANANEASRAMYNFAQALSAGAVKLIDWKSIENANMATVEFKNELIKSALALKTIKREGKQYVSTTKDLQGKTSAAFDATHAFNDSLSSQWMTTEVLIQTLGRYSDETTDLGRRAFAAAQDIKTFSQLMDTLKEAVGSGWASTFEILFGDFEEAKKLWTDVNKIVSAYIDQQSDARNNLLLGWDKLGGRTKMLDALATAFKNLMRIISPVRKAFSEVFAISPENLMSFTNTFHDFVSSLKLSDESMKNLEATFKGLFSVVDIFRRIFMQGVKALFPFIDAGGSIVDIILKITGTFGSYLTQVRDVIAQNDTIGKTFKMISDAIKHVVGFAKENFFNPSLELLGIVLGNVDEKFAALVKLSGDAKNAIKKHFDELGESVKTNPFVAFMYRITDIAKMVALKLSVGFKQALQSISKVFKESDVNGLSTFFNMASLSTIVATIARVIHKFGNSIGSFADIAENTVKILDEVKGCFKAYQSELKAKTLLTIAGAIGLLTVSLITISSIDSTKLAGAMASLSGLLIELTVAMGLLTRMTGHIRGAISSSTMMVSLSIALNTMALAMQNISEIDSEKFKQALIGISAVLTEMGLFVGIVGQLKGHLKGATQMVIFAAAVNVLAIACERMSSMDWEAMGKGLAGVGGILLEIATFLAIAKYGKTSISSATGILILSEALLVMHDACTKFAQMEWQELGKGLTAIGGLLSELMVFSLVAGKSKHILSSGVSMLAVAGALQMLIKPMAAFAQFSWTGIGKSLIVVGGALGEFAIGLKLMNGSIGGAAALTIAAAAMGLFVPILKTFGSMSIKSIGKSLIMLGGALGVIGGAAFLLQPAIPALMAFSGALSMVMLSATALLTALTAVNLAGALNALAAPLHALNAEVILQTLRGIVGLIPDLIVGFIKAIGDGIVAILDTISRSASSLGEAIKVVILTLCDVIQSTVPEIADTVLEFIATILDKLHAYTPRIIDGLVQFLVDIMDGLARNMGPLVESAMNLFASFFSSITNALSGFEPDVLLKGLAGMGILTALSVALAHLAPIIPKAMVGVAGMGVILAEITAILAAAGGIQQIPGLSWLINEGGNLLESLGVSLGRFVGGLIGGVAIGATNQLPVLAQNLSMFMEAMEPFIANAKNIDAGSMDGIGTLAGAILKITAADVLSGISSWIKGSSSMATFTSELVVFGRGLKDFADTLVGVDTNTLTTASEAGKALAEMAKAIPNSGGLAGLFAGNNDIDKFGENLVSFGKSISDFANASSNVKADSVSNVTTAIKDVTDAISKIPNATKYTKNTLTNFGRDLVGFGEHLSNFVSKTSGIDSDAFGSITEQIQNVMSLATDMQENLSKINIPDTVKLFTIDQNSINNEFRATADSMMKAFSNQIKYNHQLATNAVRYVVDQCISENRNAASKFEGLGRDTGQGFINGLKSKLTEASNAGYELGRVSLTSAKKALDSHSPSREFIHLGHNVGDGFVIGLNDSVVPAAKSTSQLIGTVLKVSSKGIKQFKEWVDEKKYYGELSLKEELTGWEQLQKKYKNGSKERKEIDREVYRLQKDLVNKTYQNSMDWIENEKYYKRLSLEQELAAYERVQSRYLAGSEERKKADREVFRLRNELMQESYQKSMDWIENEKYYDRLGALDELAAYKRVQARYKVGTEERKKADREIYRIEKEIYDAQRQYDQDVQRLNEETANKRLQAEQEYADKVREINDQMQRDIEAANRRYEDALKSRSDSLYGSWGLFDKVEEKDPVDGKELISNLESQVKEFANWEYKLRDLESRGVDKDLIDELSKMGPSAKAQIDALNSLTDSELEKYTSLWKLKHAQAREQSLKELEQMRADTDKEIAGIKEDTNRRLDECREVWADKMAEINATADQELNRLQNEFKKTVGLIRKNTEYDLGSMASTSQRLLREAGWDETGNQIVNGLNKGVIEMKPTFLQILGSMAQEGVSVVRKKLGIHSPSTVFNEIGTFAGAGFINGIKSCISKVGQTSNELGATSMMFLQESLNAISDLSDDTVFQPVIRPIFDMTNVNEGVNSMQSTFDSAIQASASMTTMNNDRSAASNISVNVDNHDIVDELHLLHSGIDELGAKMQQMRVIMDTGVLVGALSAPMDSELGHRLSLKERGVY